MDDEVDFDQASELQVLLLRDVVNTYIVGLCLARTKAVSENYLRERECQRTGR